MTDNKENQNHTKFMFLDLNNTVYLNFKARIKAFEECLDILADFKGVSQDDIIADFKANLSEQDKKDSIGIASQPAMRNFPHYYQQSNVYKEVMASDRADEITAKLNYAWDNYAKNVELNEGVLHTISWAKKNGYSVIGLSGGFAKDIKMFDDALKAKGTPILSQLDFVITRMNRGESPRLEGNFMTIDCFSRPNHDNDKDLHINNFALQVLSLDMTDEEIDKALSNSIICGDTIKTDIDPVKDMGIKGYFVTSGAELDKDTMAFYKKLFLNPNFNPGVHQQLEGRDIAKEGIAKVTNFNELQYLLMKDQYLQGKSTGYANFRAKDSSAVLTGKFLKVKEG